jgi:hypothetical protein
MTSGDATTIMSDAKAVERRLRGLISEAREVYKARAGSSLAVDRCHGRLAARVLASEFSDCQIVEPVPAAVALVVQRLGLSS